MSTARDILQKLLRSPKPRKKSDLLNQREYNLLAATSFEQFLAENFNEDQLGKLCAAEMEQLHFHYTELEKKSERTRKKIREKASKGTKGPARVVVRNVPAATVSASSIVRAVPQEVVPEVENVENTAEGDGRGEVQVEELNVSLGRIDLSRAMAPPELLLEEPEVVPLVELAEIDLGPPGDAGAFFGATAPMPMDDPQVREQVLSEFPSLRRPQIDRRYEDIDEELNARLMPPPNVPGVSGISSSTPISTDPKLRRRALGAIDLSSIRHQTAAAVDALLRSDESSPQVTAGETAAPSIETVEPEIPSIPQTSEEQTSSNVDSALPTSTEISSEPPPESMQVEPAPELLPEPIPDIQPPPTPQARPQPAPSEVPSSTSSSSTERPIPTTRGPISRIRRVPEYNPDNLVIRFQTRTTFPLGHDDDDSDASMFDTDQQLIERLLQLRAARDAADNVAQRQVPQVVTDDQQPSLRDISTGAAYADISSIREQPSAGGAQLQTSSGALYPIPERPQVEEREELALRKSLELVPTRTTPAMGDSMELRMSGKRVDSLLEPVLDVPNLEAPQIVITAETVQEQPAVAVIRPPIVEMPLEEIPPFLPVPEVHPTTADGQRPKERPREDPEQAAASKRDDQKFVELLKLYLDINHAAKTTHHGTLSVEHLEVLECAPRTKLSCCKLFARLLELKRYGLIETGVDERGRIRSVTVKG
ncbi:calphotin-like [Culex quinquefasciatus]|uniref:calphotin-like n=1 Tax=Culex quinquefasciatus TaxID=7176 RepID=UPI0018E36032|nr:calphotin-like [Culex quinquefasciatus]